MARLAEPILDPTGDAAMAADTSLAPRLQTLHGTTMGLLDNGKPNSALLLSELGEHLRRSYGVREVLMFEKAYFGTPAERPQIQQIAERCDFAVAATGD